MSGSNLKIDMRRSQILNMLHQRGKVSVAELSTVFGTTTVTIRNDLAALEKEGQLIRSHGGAVLLPKQREIRVADTLFDIKNAEEKYAIAEALVSRIRDGDTLFINSGTTTLIAAHALKERSNLNIVTNSLAVAKLLGQVPTFRVLLLGGEINAQFDFTYGGDALNHLGKFQADWAILSIDGISNKSGLTTHHAEEAVVDNMMIAGARNTWIVADHSKIGRAGFARVCSDLSGLGLITGSTDEQVLNELRQCGVEVVCI